MAAARPLLARSLFSLQFAEVDHPPLSFRKQFHLMEHDFQYAKSMFGRYVSRMASERETKSSASAGPACCTRGPGYEESWKDLFGHRRRASAGSESPSSYRPRMISVAPKLISASLS